MLSESEDHANFPPNAVKKYARLLSYLVYNKYIVIHKYETSKFFFSRKINKHTTVMEIRRTIRTELCICLVMPARPSKAGAY